MISCPTLIPGEKITLPNASFKCNTSRKKYSYGSTPVAPSSSLCPAKWVFRKNKFPFFLFACDPHSPKEKKSDVFLSPSLKHGQQPCFSLRFCCPVWSHCHRLQCQWFTTVLQSFHLAAHTNLQTWVRHRDGSVTTSHQNRWVGCGMREARLESWKHYLFLGEAWCCVNISSDVTTGKNPCFWEGWAVLVREMLWVSAYKTENTPLWDSIPGWSWKRILNRATVFC